MKKLLFISMFALTIVFASCKKDFTETIEQTPETMEDLKVPANFDWKTTTEVTVSMKSGVNGLAEVAAPNGIVYHRAFLKENETYEVKLTVPAYEKRIHLRHKGLDKAIELDGSRISHTF